MKSRGHVIVTLIVSIEGIHRLFGMSWWSVSNESTSE